MAGTSPASITNLRKKLAKFEESASAIRLVLEMLGEEAVESADARADITMRGALKLDATRRGNGAGLTHSAAMEARRRTTAEKLAAMSRTVPQSWPGRGGVAPLLHAGYIARKGNGYVWTGKPFPITWSEREAAKRGVPLSKKPLSKKPLVRSNTKAAKAAGRQRMGAFLAKFTAVEPRSAHGLGRGIIGNVVRLGYLKAKDDGYVRTEKPFTP